MKLDDITNTANGSKAFLLQPKALLLISNGPVGLSDLPVGGMDKAHWVELGNASTFTSL